VQDATAAGEVHWSGGFTLLRARFSVRVHVRSRRRSGTAIGSERRTSNLERPTPNRTWTRT